MSTISASTTSTTAYKVTADTTGTLVLQTGSTPTTAVTIGSDQSVTTAGTINGLTVGRGAGAVSTNTAVGASALAANTTGPRNTAVGYTAMYSNLTGQYNSAHGYQALYSTTGSNNTAMGHGVMFSNTSGASNSALGNVALVSNTTGSYNVAIGESALNANTTASNNTAVGYQAGYSNTTANNSTAIGYQALYTANRTADTNGSNTAVGFQSGYSTTTAQFNTLVGIQAGYYLTTGSKNTIIGGYSGNQNGLDIRTSSNYIVLSDGDGNPRGWFDNSGDLYIGTTDTGFFNGSVRGVGILGGSNGFIAASRSGAVSGIFNRYTSDGDVVQFRRSGTAVGSVSVTTTATAYNTSSDYRLKNTISPMTGALAKVALLKPCTYKWNADGSDGEGFIAHELAEVVPQCVTGEKDAVDADGKPQYQGIDTSFLVATLTAALQELKAEFDAYKEAHP